MKKILTILLLGVLLFNMVGYYFVFVVQRQNIRSEIKQRIKQSIAEEELHFFTFTKTQLQDIQWERKGKEFRLGSEMFDVVRKEERGDTVYFWCVNDTEEKALFAELDEMVKQELGNHDEHHRRHSKKSSKPIKSLVYTLPKTNINGLNVEEGSNINNGFVHFYAAPIIEAISPPPQLV